MDILQYLGLFDIVLPSLGILGATLKLYLIAPIFIAVYHQALVLWFLSSITITEDDTQYPALEQLLAESRQWTLTVRAWRLLSPKYGMTQGPHFVPQDGSFQIFKIEGSWYIITRALRRAESVYQERKRSITLYNLKLKNNQELIESLTEISCHTGTFRLVPRWLKTTTLKPYSSQIHSTRGKQAEIFSYIEEFLSNDTKQQYSIQEIAYRTGLLLFGPPGTGKSTTVKKVARRFSLSIYKVNLHELNDSQAECLFAELPKRCIVLIEDFDGGKLGMGGTVTLSCLLPLLDGPTSHEDHILIITTNYPERIPDALRRNGRIDKEYYFGFASPDECGEMFIKMYPGREDLRDAFVDSLKGHECSIADLQGLLTGYRDPEETVRAVEPWIKERDREKQAKEEATNSKKPWMLSGFTWENSWWY